MSVQPPDLPAAWRGWPESFAGADCAISGSVGADSDVIYFFYGEEFISYDLGDDKVVISQADQLKVADSSARSYADHTGSSRPVDSTQTACLATSWRGRCRVTLSVWYE